MPEQVRRIEFRYLNGDPLGAAAHTPGATAEDCAREGFPHLTPAEFCEFYRRQA